MTQIFVAQESSAGDAKTVAGPMPTPETYLLGLSLAVRDRASASGRLFRDLMLFGRMHSPSIAR